MTWRDRVAQVWPCPECESQLNPPVIFERYGAAVDRIRSCTEPELLRRVTESAKEILSDTQKARERLEQRAGAVLAAVGIMVALQGALVAFGAPAMRTGPILMSLQLGTLVVSFLYLLGALMASVRVHGRFIRHMLGPEDVAPEAEEGEEAYARRLAASLVTYAVENYRVNNRAVALLLAGIDRLRNAVLLFAMAATILAVVAVLRR